MKNNKEKIKRLFYLRVAVLMTFFLGLCFAFSPLQVQAARLFGVTGDGASLGQEETLFELNQTDASSTLLTALGNGSGGEAIAFNPDDGLLYHWSGAGVPNDDVDGEIFESIDPNPPFTITHITLSGADYDEVLAATYNPSTGGFLVVDIFNFLYTVTTGGTVAFIGEITDIGFDPPKKITSKGLAFVDGKLYSIERRVGVPPHLFEIDLTSGSIGSILSSIEIELPGFTIAGGNGLATDPDTGELWGLLRESGSPKLRHLVTFANDPDGVPTGVATNIGLLGDAFASIAFGPSTIEFSDFTLKKTMVKFKHTSNNDRFLVRGEFVLGDGSDEINPVDDVVSVIVGASSIEIPPGSFKQKPPGTFKFMGLIPDTDVYVRMKIQWIDDNTFKFKIMARGVDLTGTSNPVDVGLAVGNDVGQLSIRLKGLLFKHNH